MSKSFHDKSSLSRLLSTKVAIISFLCSPLVTVYISKIWIFSELSICNSV